MHATRDPSLDAFRGLTVMLMIIVNLQGNGDAAFSALKHVEWDGLSFADLVFPWFLLIVGLSVPLALDRAHNSSPWPQVVKRSLILIALGVLLAWLIRPVSFDQIRWMGVLQRIGIVYLACAAIVLFRPGWKVASVLAAVILALHSWLILHVPAPGEAVAAQGPGEGLSGWLDRATLPGRLLRKTWDPEGVLSTLPAIANGLIGVAVIRWLKTGGANIVKPALICGTAMLALGVATAAFVPVNKALWTSSFVLITCGLGLILWMGLRIIWPKMGGTGAARLSVLYGQTALTFYTLHMLLLAVIVRKLGDGTRLWDWLFAQLVATGLSLPIASLIFALIAGALCTWPLPALKRKGWLLKA